ncbi:MAG: ATP-dependent helicase UvrD/PcrA [Actinomycetia bacterium]|nr:ATP-dependent helicase UvrD/PcrA [Actinomycetes bacterium]
MPAPSPFPGPAALGRGVVTIPGRVIEGFEAATRVLIDDATLDSPEVAIRRLHDAWVSRTPVVVELGVDASALQQSETRTDPPWRLDVSFGFARERLAFLVWANTYDARTGTPVWWWANKAARLGATATPEGPADIALTDGTPAWVDGGPRGLLDMNDVIVHRESVDLGVLTRGTDRPPSADLAPDQLDAVCHRAGPARVIAPAGSGKTRVLTERVRHLIVDRAVEPGLVTAVAYNTKAADEMRTRCGFESRTGPQVRTFHALGYALLREFAGGPRVVDERDARERVGALVDVRYATNTDPIAPYLEALGSVRLALRDPEDVEAERDDVPGFAAMFEAYRDGLRADNAIDFDEQIYGAIELLLRDPDARRVAQRRCRHLLVDEFQDLTPAFLLFARLLAAPAYQVFGVGDDDQTIYGYAGADPGYLVDFATLFPGATEHALEVNYRCPTEVVQATTQLLRHNRRRVTKHVQPGPNAAAGGLSLRREPADLVAPAVVEQVRAWLDARTPPHEIAVLARVNAWLLAPQVLLAQAGVPIDGGLDTKVLQRTGLRSALAYVRLAFGNGRYRGADLAEVANRPSRRITSRARDVLRRRRQWSRADLANYGAGREVGRDAERVADLLDALVALESMAKSATTAQILTHVRDRIGLGSAMQTLDGSSTDVNGSHADDLAALVQVSSVHDDPITFEAWLHDALSQPRTSHGVRLASVHRVKGLEFDAVIALGVHRPHDLALDVEEERRIAHVAITRARKDAHVIASVADNAPFLEEMAGLEPAEPVLATPRLVEAVTGGVARPSQKERDAQVVEAAVGLAVTIEGGDSGEIEGIEPDFAKVAFGGGGWVRAPWGTAVRTAGGRALLEPPGYDAISTALTTWRGERAAADKVPAYVVMHNSTRDAIARARPRSIVELSRCAGIGPTKLERYGDDVLVAVEQALGAADTADAADSVE